uniref:Glucose-methanol-choline oxidoreductase N-terminal domain-containing protein n=1 Tax=Ciona savignyi TaxID=51511 RepID=H2YS53_CIOSA
VVVGSGTSGNVIATRLTESPNIKVLVLEAGDDDAPNPLISVPILCALAQKSSIDWEYKTIPQTHACKGLKEKSSLWPRGKTLGGTSSINNMVFARGSRHDYDEWEDMGAAGWGYDDVLPYFKKLEDVSNLGMNSEYRGKDGPLKLSYSYSHPVTHMFVDAARELDYNGKNGEGFGITQATILPDGQRENSVTSFIRPVISKRRDRLHIVARAHVRQVVFEDDGNQGKRASGVVYVRDGMEFKVRATKEVIVCGGAVGSPQLLMLSGIGPKEHLKSKGIEVVADLQGVGSNLQDHIMIPTTFHASNLTSYFAMDYTTVPRGIFPYLLGYGGPLTSAVAEANGYIRSRYAQVERYYILQKLCVFFLILFMIVKMYTVATSQTQRMYDWAKSHNTNSIAHFAILAGLIRPSSVGTIRLNTSNYRDYPLIDPQYLTTKRDVEILIEAMRKIEELEKTEAFKKIGAKMELDHFGCGNQISPRSDDFYECLIRSITLTIYHPVGTAKIGSSDDIMAVVDPRLKVYKVNGLRVADASVIPSIPSANTQAACYMIGEKAADMIKQDW